MKNIEKRTPVSGDLVCDVLIFFFALWTITCNIVVFSGGNLFVLISLFAVILFCVTFICLKYVSPKELYSFSSYNLDKRAALSETYGSRLFHSPSAVCVNVFSALFICLLFYFTKNYQLFWVLAALYFLLNVIRMGIISPVLPSGKNVIVQDKAVSESALRERKNDKYFLTGLVLLGVFVTLVANRPDIDDTFYVNLAVSAVDSPDMPLVRHDTMHNLKDASLENGLYRVNSFELLAAVVSYLTGLKAIYVLHIIFAAIAGGLIPLAIGRVFRHLLPEKWLWAVVTVMAIYIFIGDSNRWYSNQAFVRVFQGKAIFISIVIPLIISYSIELNIFRGKKKFLLLFCSQVGAIGLTTSACLMAPIVMFFAMVASMKLERATLGLWIFTCLASSYPLLMGRMLYLNLQEFKTVSSETKTLPPPDLNVVYDSLDWLFGNHYLMTVSMFAIMCSWLFVSGYFARRFVFLYSSLFFFLFLNPFLARFLGESITGSYFYIRFMWIYPFPFFLAIIILFPIGVRYLRKFFGFGLFGINLACVLLLIPEKYTLSSKNHVTIKFPTIKSPERFYNIAKRLASYVQGERVIVPFSVATMLPLIHNHPYPLLARRLYSGYMLSAVGFDEASMRFFLQQYVSGLKRHPDITVMMKKGFKDFSIKGVVLFSGMAWKDEAVYLLKGENFYMKEDVGGYEIWLKKLN